MLRRLRALIGVMAFIVLTLSPSLCDAKGWEAVRADVSGLNSVARDSDVEIRVSPGHVVVTAAQPVQIKVFTILGQVVSNETLQAGTSRLPLSHGVYIVKVGDLTCKIAV